MALWGTADAVYATGTIAVDLANKTITGTNSTFTSAAAGDVISVGAAKTWGEAVISSVSSDTVVSIASTQHLEYLVDGLTGIAYTISQKPNQLLVILTMELMISLVSILVKSHMLLQQHMLYLMLVGLESIHTLISMELSELSLKYWSQ